MPTHLIVSHGAVLFGEEHFSVSQLRDLGHYARSVLPLADREPLTRVLDDAGEREHAFSATEAALFAVLLRRMAASRSLKRPYADVTARLGHAAAAAAGDSTPWTWTPTEEGVR